jgi:hypothetical protein
MSMKPAARLLPRSARLILPAAAVITAVGGAAAIASPVQARLPIGHANSAPARSATFTWHPLKLLHGWKSASTRLVVTGTPAWALRDGVVYLRGAIKQPKAAGSSTFAALPKDARPASVLYIQVFSRSDVPGILNIDSNGELEAYDGNAYAFTSLSGVSYPAAPVKLHAELLLNGWQSSQSVYSTGGPSDVVRKGVVYLSGSMHGGSTPLAFILPKAARPAHTLYISVYTFDGTNPGLIEIVRQGEVEVTGMGAVGFTSLANISFPVAATKWHKFKLKSGWKAIPHFDGGPPVYAVVNGVVYLGGAIQQPHPGGSVWTNIPAAARAAGVVDIEVATNSGSVGALTVTSRLGYAHSVPVSNARLMTSLAGVAYPPSA